MFRRLILSTLTALAVLSSLFLVTPTPALATGAASRGMSEKYSVYYRTSGTSKWTRYGAYTSHDAAKKVIVQLYGKGYQVELRSTHTLTRDDRRPSTTGTVTTAGAVSYKKAQEVFRWMASQRDIPFRYPVDGCYARAHIMIRRMQKNGFRPAKVWAFAPTKSEPLYVRTGLRLYPEVTWGYHVAPVIRVQLKNGTQQWFVIDPSLFKNGPVTVSQWRDRQRPKSGRSPIIKVTRLGESPIPGVRGCTGYSPAPDPREGADAHAVKLMRRYKTYERRRPTTLASAWSQRQPNYLADIRSAGVAIFQGTQLTLAA
jgi:hypothetical protein